MFLATQSSDRTCRIFGHLWTKCEDSRVVAKEMVVLQVIQKRSFDRSVLSSSERQLASFKSDIFESFSEQNYSKKRTLPYLQLLSSHMMFCDENGPIFRRLSWSPDGSFLAVPAGIYRYSPFPWQKLEQNTTYLFSRENLSQPIGHLPALNSPTSVAQWCPLLFKNRRKKIDRTISKLPYRMLLAVASQDSILVYDTETMQCIIHVGGLH